jgi:protein O-GlcNAc transferase
LNMRIALYCGDNFVPWGPRSLYSGIGGSEEAAIHMARELAHLGCDLTVYGKPLPGSAGKQDGVRWLDYQSFANERPGDIFIAWRHAEYVALGAGWTQVYHWLHNRQDLPYPAGVAAQVDRVLLVSQHHGSDPGWAALDRRKIYYTSNGLDPAFLREPGHNQPERAIYASCPARGLLLVLDMWPHIQRAVPTAKLDVYNGFTPVYEAMAQYYPGLLEIKAAVLARLDQDGVTFHGMVGQDRLAEGFAKAGVWVYPTDCPETSCITAIKALAMGCLPVTSGYAALSETLGGRDFGPVDPDRPIGASKWRMWKFRRRVIKLMKRGASPALMAKRLAWSEWARQRYSWKDIAADWLALFREVEREKSRTAPAPQLAAIQEAP